MFTINCFKDNCDIKYAALGNNELLQKVKNGDTTKLFLVGIHSMQGLTACTREGVTRKRSTKRLKHTGNLFRKNLQLKDVC